MKVQWYGHSCFLFEGQGVRLVTDPPAGKVGYLLPDVEVDLATVSHGHQDHNNVNALHGAPAVISTPGAHEVEGLKIVGYSAFHDQDGGAQRGTNLLFAWELDGVRVCHLGDLGHLLDDQTLRDLGRVDLLLVPVGGVFTIDAAGARQVVDQVGPRLVIPMHYQTPALSFRLGGVEEFVRRFQAGQVRREQALNVEAANLPEALEVVVLDYVR